MITAINLFNGTYKGVVYSQNKIMQNDKLIYYRLDFSSDKPFNCKYMIVANPFTKELIHKIIDFNLIS